MPQLRTELVKDDFCSLPYIDSVSVEEQPIEDTVTVFDMDSDGNTSDYMLDSGSADQKPVLGKSDWQDEDTEDSSLSVLYLSLSESSTECIQTVQSMVTSLISSYCYQFSEYSNPAVIAKHIEEDNEICVFIVPM